MPREVSVQIDVSSDAVAAYCDQENSEEIALNRIFDKIRIAVADHIRKHQAEHGRTHIPNTAALDLTVKFKVPDPALVEKMAADEDGDLNPKPLWKS